MAELGAGADPPQDRPTLPGKRWTDADGVHIDVRGLDPPAPLVAILSLIDAMTEPATVFVHHDRDPQLLYPELAERGWVAESVAAPEGEVRLKLERFA